MVAPFSPPTRAQLAAMARGDERLLRSLEGLYRSAGEEVPVEFDELAEDVAENTADIVDIKEDVGELTVAPDALARGIALLNGKQSTVRSLELGQFVFVADRYDFPKAVGGVITLADNVAYFLTDPFEMIGDRLVGGLGSVVHGPGQDISKLTSTGLTATALITSTQRISLRDIDIHDVDIAVDLDAVDLSDFMVWERVSFTNVPEVGRIANYNSFVMSLSGMSNSANLVFDGTIGTVGLTDMFILGIAGETSVSVPSTATITRRFRIRFSAIITPATATAIDVDVLAGMPDESYILIDCNFSGAGTPIVGVQFDDNKAMFTANIGIDNSRTFAQLYMTNNATPTPVTVSTPTKFLGTTSENPINQRFTHTDNRETYTGALTRDFKVDIIAALSSNNNNVLRLYVARNGTAIIDTYGEGTANAGGKAEGISTAVIVELTTGDYIEAFGSNESGSNDITDINLNMIIGEL